MYSSLLLFLFFFFNDTATTQIYTLSLHDALPIFTPLSNQTVTRRRTSSNPSLLSASRPKPRQSISRSEEHTSELQSRRDLVCRLLLEKKKKKKKIKKQYDI